MCHYWNLDYYDIGSSNLLVYEQGVISGLKVVTTDDRWSSN